MKKLFSLALLFLSLGARADRPSVHGMFLFGGRHLYASHLPMFHSPHDYQFIFELKWGQGSDPAALQNFQALLVQGLDFFTLEPEVMDLVPVMQGQKTQFRAQLYASHFERGGEPLGSVVVEVSKIIVARKLNPQDPNFEQFLIFGEEGEHYAAHLIGGKPSYDWIGQVQLNSALVSPVLLGGSGSIPVLGEEFEAQGLRATVRKILYSEVEELSH
jgi:hypothetical protein